MWTLCRPSPCRVPSSRSGRVGPWIAAVGGLVAAVLTVGRADAIEQQHHFGLDPTLGMLKVDDKSTVSVGLGGGLHYTYGLSDTLNLALEASHVVVAASQRQDAPDSPRTRPATVDHVAAGVDYVIDILRWVPYVGARAGAYRLGGGTLDTALFLPGVSACVGLDYQINRRWAVGLAGHQHLLFTKPSTYPSYTTALLRFEYMWGY